MNAKLQISQPKIVLELEYEEAIHLLRYVRSLSLEEARAKGIGRCCIVSEANLPYYKGYVPQDDDKTHHIGCQVFKILGEALRNQQ